MVDLPQTPIESITSEAPRSSLSPGQIAQPYEQLGAAFDKLGDGLGKASESLAEQAGYQAVTRDADGNIQVEKAPIVGPAAAAYSRAVKFAALAEGEGDAKRADIEMRQQYRDDPAGYLAAADKFKDGLQKKYTDAAGPEVGIAMGRSVDAVTTQTYRGLLNEKERLDLQRASTSIDTGIQSARDDLVALARGGVTSGPQWDGLRDKVQTLTAEKVNNPRLAYPQVAADYDMQSLDGDLRANGALYHVDQIYKDKSTNADGTAAGGYQPALDAAKSILTDPTLKLTEPQRQAYYSKAVGEIHTNEAIRKQDVAEVRAGFQSLQMQSAYGLKVESEQIESLATAARAAGAPGEAARIYAMGIRMDLKDDFGRQPIAVQTQQYNALNTGSGIGTSHAEVNLIQHESGGNPVKVNQFGYAGLYQFGAPLLSDLGIYKPGDGENLKTWSKTSVDAPGKWSGTFSVPGFPEVKTLKDFLANPAAQKAAFDAHTANMDAAIDVNGMDKYIGRSVGGVPITREGLHAMIHLGGVGGAMQTLGTNGAISARDANGTSLLDYARIGSNASAANPATSMWLTANRGRTLDKTAETAWATITKDWNEKGIRPSDDVVNQVVIAARATKNQGLLEQIGVDADGMQTGRGLVGRINLAQQQAGQPLPQQQADNTALNAAGNAGQLSPGQQAVLGDLDRRYKAITTGLKENPIATVTQNFPDKFPPLPPLDLSNPQSLAAGLQERSRRAQFGAANWQTPPLSVLDKPDVQAVQGALNSQNAPQVLGTIAQTLKPPEMQTLLGNEDFRKSITGMARSGDPTKMNAAYSFMDAQQKQNPLEFEKQFPDGLKDLRAWQSNLSFYPPDVAAKRLMQSYDPAQSAARKATDEVAKKALESVSADNVVSKFSTGFGPFGVGARAPAAENVGIAKGALKADYDENYRDGFAATGDASAADKFAMEKLNLKYAVSPTNNNRVTAYAPERYYPQVGGSHDWMAKQLDDAVEKATGVDRTSVAGETVPGVGFVSNNVFGDQTPGERQYRAARAILPDATTERDIANGKPPSYQVILQDTNGRWSAMTAPKVDNSNLQAAGAAMNLTPQEKALYERHLTNLTGTGGVDNPDGSRSSLFQAVQPHDGKFYNIPTVWNGKIETEKWTNPGTGKVFDVPNKTAIANVEKEGWDKFPSYATPGEADARYMQMHNYMDKDTGTYMASRSGQPQRFRFDPSGPFAERAATMEARKATIPTMPPLTGGE